MAFGKPARNTPPEASLDLTDRLSPYGETDTASPAPGRPAGPDSALHPMASVRLLIADDLPAIRTMMTLAVSLVDGIAIVGEANDGAEAVELCGRLHPDVVLLDVDMPGMDGITAIPLIRAAHPGVKVAMYSNDGTAERASLAAGADAYFLKLATTPSSLLGQLQDLCRS
ncbi:MAG: hypothetical protein NVSMB4_09340 [Acidimicrobiales bacterium]